MFKTKIKENEYLVFKRQEINIIGEAKNNIIPCPDYYSLEIIPGQIQLIKYTNTAPVIINHDSIETDLNTINFSFGVPITTEEYNMLYELYLNQMEKNPTPEYQKEVEIKQDVEFAKTLVKNRKRA